MYGPGRSKGRTPCEIWLGSTRHRCLTASAHPALSPTIIMTLGSRKSHGATMCSGSMRHSSQPSRSPSPQRDSLEAIQAAWRGVLSEA